MAIYDDKGRLITRAEFAQQLGDALAVDAEHVETEHEAGFWKQRYDTQHRKLHEMEDLLAERAAKYNALVGLVHALGEELLREAAILEEHLHRADRPIGAGLKRLGNKMMETKPLPTEAPEDPAEKPVT